MKFKIKDPGSAITHFIACVMAVLAAAPLLLKAAREQDKIHLIAMCIFYFEYDSVVCSEYDLSHSGFN